MQNTNEHGNKINEDLKQGEGNVNKWEGAKDIRMIKKGMEKRKRKRKGKEKILWI